MKSMRAALCFVLILTLMLSTARAADLKSGDASEEVETLELRLNALGYSVGDADSVFDAVTEEAVSSFQRDRGLQVTGNVNPLTWKALFDDYVTLSWEDYEVRVKLAAPFSAISSNKEFIGGMTYKDVECVIFLDAADSLAQFADDDIAFGRSYYEEDLMSDHPDGHFNLAQQEITVGTRAAITAHAAMDWTEDGTAHFMHVNWGWMEMTQVDGKSVIFSVLITQRLEGTDEPPITENTMLDILSHVLGEGEEPEEDSYAAAARRVAELDPAAVLPYFEPVEDGATPTDVLESIHQYVDPAQEGIGERSVEMYYGAKLMDWYLKDLAAGDDAAVAQRKARLFVKYSPAAAEDPAGLKVKTFATMMAVRVSLADPFKPYLAAMGAEDANWTYEDVEVMHKALMDGFDDLLIPSVISREDDAAAYAALVRGALAGLAAAEFMSYKVEPPEWEEAFRLPAGTAVIDEYAFSGIAAVSVYVPDACQSIGQGAFQDCPNLRYIRIPAGCAIADDAFQGCASVSIFGAPGSPAEAFAQTHDNCAFFSEDDQTAGE